MPRLIGFDRSTARYRCRRPDDADLGGRLRALAAELDFASDALTDGRRFPVLCVLDDFSRDCMALVVDTSISSKRVARELHQLITWPESVRYFV